MNQETKLEHMELKGWKRRKKIRRRKKFLPWRRACRIGQAKSEEHCRFHHWKPRSYRQWGPSWHQPEAWPSPWACWNPPRPDPSTSKNSTRSHRMPCHPQRIESHSSLQNPYLAVGSETSSPPKSCKWRPHMMQIQELGTATAHCLLTLYREDQKFLRKTGQQLPRTEANWLWRCIYIMSKESKRCATQMGSCAAINCGDERCFQSLKPWTSTTVQDLLDGI